MPLARRQQADWIDRLTLSADFKMQLGAVGIGTAQLSNFLSGAHALPFLDQHIIVVCIDREKLAGVLYYHHLAVTAQTATDIRNLASGRREHRLTGLASNIDALVSALAEPHQYLARSRPEPGDR